jgi:[ribosomal protein S18]-alanine N-acetyltransferase
MIRFVCSLDFVKVSELDSHAVESRCDHHRGDLQITLPLTVRRKLMITFEPWLQLARLADAEVIANMSRLLIEAGLGWRWTPQRVAASIRAPNVNVLVARVDNHIVGFAIMRYGDDAAHLDLLAVAPAYRRAGVGCRLLKWLEKCAVVAGIVKIDLEVRAQNHGAQVFYERMGYRTQVNLPGYYEGIEDALRMRRDLSQ